MGETERWEEELQREEEVPGADPEFHQEPQTPAAFLRPDSRLKASSRTSSRSSSEKGRGGSVPKRSSREQTPDRPVNKSSVPPLELGPPAVYPATRAPEAQPNYVTREE